MRDIRSLVLEYESICRPYYELKAEFNHMLELQKQRVQALEVQVSASKFTYADALRNLEQISDEIHRSRSKTHSLLNNNNASMHNLKPLSSESSTSISEDFSDTSDEYKCLPNKLNYIASPLHVSSEEVDGYKSVILTNAELASGR